MSNLDGTRSVHGASHPPAATGAYSSLDSALELVQVLDRYFADLQAGRTPDKDKLLADHPALARQLEECLAGIEFVHRAAKPQSETPTQLGDFRILREVGRGGMGVVYEAEQLSLKRKVALKVLRFGVTADAEVMKRFQREAETVAHLHHTNIVPIHAVGCEQGVHYYAMQFIEGKSLAAVFDESNTPPTRSASDGTANTSLALGASKRIDSVREIARWGLQAAEALAHAHQRGVIHRDIKPSNLILDPEGTVWLTDFGLAKRADEVTLTAAGVLMGTPRYMSPEQAASAKLPIDHRTDIYSLGATLYELATGKPVFEAQTPQGVITQILNSEPVAPRLIQGRLSRDLETIILKCLAKDPGKRYQQARALADDLRAFLENRAIKARRPSFIEKAVRLSRQKRGTGRVAAVAVVASVLLLAGGIFGWSWYHQAQLGQVKLVSSGPTLVAEILDERDRLVVPSFSVPTAQPVSVPKGNYRLRLSGSGMLSETWPLEVLRGEETQHDASLQPRWLWTPLEIRPGTRHELVNLEGRSDLLLISSTERSVRRFGGVGGTSLWEKDFVFDAKSLPTGENPDEWLNLGSQPVLVPPFHDLNGDGVRDIVLAGKESPMLAALSGKDGSLLWHVRGRGDSLVLSEPGFADIKRRLQSLGSGRVLGQPAMIDLDGEAVVIAAFSHEGLVFAYENGTTQHWVMWVEALSGKTGKSLWKYRLDKEQLGTPSSYEPFPDPRPQIAKADGRPIVVFTASAGFIRLDARTGKELDKPVDLKYLPQQPLQIANIDNGQPAVLMARDAEFSTMTSTRVPEGGGPPVVEVVNKPVPTPMLMSRSLRTGQVLWERPFQPLPEHRGSLKDSKRTFLLLNEQNHSGGPVCVLPKAVEHQHNDPNKHSSYSGLELIDAATGATRWQRRLWINGVWQANEVLRFLFGPDLDGDGEREIFVAWIGEYRYWKPNNPPCYLCVEALSGKDGRTLWRWRKEVPSYSSGDDAIPLHWWNTGADGWPQLVVPVQRGPGGQPTTYVLSAATGRLSATIPEVTEFQVADCNGDGLGDLVYRFAAQGAPRLVVLPGRPAPAWQTMEGVRAGQDFDGDGITDVFTWNDRQARSGSDGRKLWSKDFPGGWPEHTIALPPRADDANGSGRAEIVHLGNYGPLLTAYSGKDLRPLWHSQRQATGENVSTSVGGRQYRYPAFGWALTTDKGLLDYLFVSKPKGDDWSTSQFGVISGKDGLTRWEAIVAAGGFDSHHRYGRFDVDDLNENGWRDFIVWVPGKSSKDGSPVSELQALDGETGKPIWEKSPIQVQASPPHGTFIWPRPLCFDWDGDGKPDIILAMRGDQHDQALGGTPFELVVIDGRTGTKKAPARRGLSNGYDAVMPLVINWDGTGRNTLCLPVLANNQASLDFLQFKGPVRPSIPLKNFDPAAGWNALDLNGDGKDDLGFIDDNKLWAYRGGVVDAAWSWPLQGQPSKLLHLEPVNRHHPATIVVWRGHSIYGLDWSDGHVRWRCEANTNPPADSSYDYMPAWGMLRTANPGFLPRFLSRYGENWFAMYCVQALPTTPAGVYLQEEPAPLESMPEVDQHFYRTLPWGHGDVYLGWYTLIGHVLFALCLLYWALRRRWIKLTVFLGIAIAITVTLAIVMVKKEGKAMYPEERYSWESWYILLYLGIGVAALPWFLWLVCSVVFRILVRLARPRPA